MGVGVMHLLRFVVGFLTQPLLAAAFGLGRASEVYAVSTEIVRSFWLIWEKVVNPAFLPTFIRAMKEEGEERAWKLASTAVWLTLGSLLLTTVGAWILMPQIVGLYSDAASAQERAQTVHASRWLLLSLALLGMSSLTYTILNGYKRFVIAAAGDTLWKLGPFFAAVVITQFGIAPTSALWWVIGGYVVGAAFKLLPHLLAIGSKWKYLRPRIDLNDPLARVMLALALPLLLGIAVSESRGVYLSRLADSPLIPIDAGRVAVKWSRTIGDALIQIFPYALSIGIFPYLADMARERDRQPLTDTLMGALRACFFFFGPVTAILIALHFPLLRAVWESGRFTQENTLALSLPFIGFTLGLIGFACEMMLSQTFYAMTRAWTPTLIGLATSVVWIIVATLGVNAGWGLFAIAAAESFSKSLKCVVMWVMLRPHLGDTKAREMMSFLAQVLVLSLAAAAVAWAAQRFLVPVLAPEGASRWKIRMLLIVATSGIGAMVLYFAAAYLVKMREAEQVLTLGSKMKGKLRRKKA
jgi:putative peptidoglycan lipid II flippase